jgi:hypothetical protein
MPLDVAADAGTDQNDDENYYAEDPENDGLGAEEYYNVQRDMLGMLFDLACAWQCSYRGSGITQPVLRITDQNDDENYYAEDPENDGLGAEEYYEEDIGSVDDYAL